jgi:hypothetical protein
LSAPSGGIPIASDTAHCGQKQILCAPDFCRGFTPTVCANIYTATDLSPGSISRLQRKQEIGCTSSFPSPEPDGLSHSYDPPAKRDGASEKEDSCNWEDRGWRESLSAAVNKRPPLRKECKKSAKGWAPGRTCFRIVPLSIKDSLGRLRCSRARRRECLPELCPQ